MAYTAPTGDSVPFGFNLAEYTAPRGTSVKFYINPVPTLRWEIESEGWFTPSARRATIPPANAVNFTFPLNGEYVAYDGDAVHATWVDSSVPEVHIVAATNTGFVGVADAYAVLSISAGAGTYFPNFDTLISWAGTGTAGFVTDDRNISVSGVATPSFSRHTIQLSDLSAQSASTVYIEPFLQCDFVGSSTLSLVGNKLVSTVVEARILGRAYFSGLFNKDVAGNVFGKAVFSPVLMADSPASLATSGYGGFSPSAIRVSTASQVVSSAAAGSFISEAAHPADVACSGASIAALSSSATRDAFSALPGSAQCAFVTEYGTIFVPQLPLDADAVFSSSAQKVVHVRH